MKNFLIYYVFITLSIIVNSCSEGGLEDSKIFIALKEVTAVTTPTIDSTPDYTSVPPSQEPSLTVVHALQVLTLQTPAIIQSL